MDVTQQVIDALLLPFAVFGGMLLLLLLLVLRLTYQTALLARRQRKMLATLDDGKPPNLRRRAEQPARPPEAPAAPVEKPPLLALPAADEVPEVAETDAEPQPPSDAAVELDENIEPIKVRRDAEFGVIYTFRGKDYLSRVAADQARWRSLNEPARRTRSEVG